MNKNTNALPKWARELIDKKHNEIMRLRAKLEEIQEICESR